MEIVLTNRSEDRLKLLVALEVFAQEEKLPARVVQATDLALEEHLTNILSYAYDQPGDHVIRVRFVLEDDYLRVEVEDDGKPFNPLERSEVDTTVPLDSKPVGGLGIHLIREFMDEVGYRREAGRNILCMRKRLRAGEART